MRMFSDICLWHSHMALTHVFEEHISVKNNTCLRQPPPPHTCETPATTHPATPSTPANSCRRTTHRPAPIKWEHIDRAATALRISSTANWHQQPWQRFLDCVARYRAPSLYRHRPDGRVRIDARRRHSRGAAGAAAIHHSQAELSASSAR